MELAINLAIIGLAIIGGLYALGLIIVAFIGPPTTHDYLDDCDCQTCSCDIYPIDACSSECDEECAANEHCSAPDPWCGCPSCTLHRLDEMPPTKEQD